MMTDTPDVAWRGYVLADRRRRAVEMIGASQLWQIALA